jgi:hypothetical protein
MRLWGIVFFRFPTVVGSVQSMPIRVQDARRLANLLGDQRKLLISDPTHIDRDVKQIVRRKLGSQSPRYVVYILEAFDDARDRAGIRVGDDVKPSP